MIVGALGRNDFVASVALIMAVAIAGSCAAHFTLSGGMPGVSVPADYVPAMHSDGGQPERRP